MISFLQLAGLLILFLAYKAYITLAVPRELKHVPAISLIATLTSMLKGESYELRFERLLRPILEKAGVARVWNQGGWELVIGDAKQVKEILAKVDVYLKRCEEDVNLKLMLSRKTMGFRNIVNSDGGEWYRHRRIANPAFKKTWSTDMFGSCTQNMIALIRAADGAPLQVDGLFQRLTLDILGKGMFSYDFEAISKGNKNHYLLLYNDIMKAMFDPIYMLFPLLEKWVPWRQISHQKGQEFRSFLRGIIRARKAELTKSHDDLLSLMIKASIEEKDANLSEEEVINDLSIFFLAGHDTTANTLITTFYYLSKHPDIQEKAREEVDAVLNGEKRVPTAEELKELHYIDCVIKESMRIVSTVQQLRRYCRDGDTFSSGFSIPKHTYVNLQLWNIHHDEKVYPDPYSFNPERFKDLYGPQTSQWMPFGFGPRMCKLHDKPILNLNLGIGKNFAVMEQRVVISMLLQSFTFTLGPSIGRTPTPTISSSALLHPVGVDIAFLPLKPTN